MKLVLIQGDILAQYIGRQQGPVVRIDWDTDPLDARATIEDFRLNGLGAVDDQG